MEKPSEDQLRHARMLGAEAGDRRHASVSENPFDVALQRELHDAWEEGRQDGILNH